MAKKKPLDFSELKTLIIQTAEKDTKFRNKLKKDPKGEVNKMIRKEFPDCDYGELPYEVNVVVVEDNENTAYINLDPKGITAKSY